MNHFEITQVAPRIRRVTFANPPVNLVSTQALTELSEVTDLLSRDEQVHVAISDSATPGYFMNHADSDQFAELLSMTGENATTPIFTDLTTRLTTAPFVSIAAIRGRTRGGGAELFLAFDLRYASREEAIFSQPEVAIGLLAGGGAGERLPRLISRDRALEVFFTGDDYDATRAEQYGWVTRTMPDAELDAFVDATATRIASFDKQALANAKAQINRSTLPPKADMLASADLFSRAVTWPGFQSRVPAMGRLLTEVGVDEVERNLGRYLGMTANQR